jgi:hypothetical protein
MRVFSTPAVPQTTMPDASEPHDTSLMSRNSSERPVNRHQRHELFDLAAERSVGEGGTAQGRESLVDLGDLLAQGAMLRQQVVQDFAMMLLV